MKVDYPKGTPVDLSKKPAYVKANVQTSRLNAGGDKNPRGSRKGVSKAGGKSMGKAY